MIQIQVYVYFSSFLTPLPPGSPLLTHSTWLSTASPSTWFQSFSFFTKHISFLLTEANRTSTKLRQIQPLSVAEGSTRFNTPVIFPTHQTFHTTICESSPRCTHHIEGLHAQHGPCSESSPKRTYHIEGLHAQHGPCSESSPKRTYHIEGLHAQHGPCSESSPKRTYHIEGLYAQHCPCSESSPKRTYHIEGLHAQHSPPTLRYGPDTWNGNISTNLKMDMWEGEALWSRWGVDEVKGCREEDDILHQTVVLAVLGVPDETIHKAKPIHWHDHLDKGNVGTITIHMNNCHKAAPSWVVVKYVTQADKTQIKVRLSGSNSTEIPRVGEKIKCM